MTPLALDRERACTLGAGARAGAERLDWACELDRLDESYREVISGYGEPIVAASA